MQNKKKIKKASEKIAKTINRDIFNNWLPNLKVTPVNYVIKTRPNIFGFYHDNVCYLILPEIKKHVKKHYKAKGIEYRHLFMMVAHEIIHQAQDFFNCPYGHNNKTFRYYAQKIQNRYELPIKIESSQHIDSFL